MLLILSVGVYVFFFLALKLNANTPHTCKKIKVITVELDLM